MSDAVKLIVGLGNPGDKYTHSRHNAGFWFIDALVEHYNLVLKPEKKFYGAHAVFVIDDVTIHLLRPDTFMNLSGRALVAIAQYYKISPSQILVAYDDMELAVGNMKLKDTGGHSGHNGISNIMQLLGAKDFKRLRIGINRPPTGADVSSYVLSKMPSIDKEISLACIDKAVDIVPELTGGNWQVAIQELQRFINEYQRELKS